MSTVFVVRTDSKILNTFTTADDANALVEQLAKESKEGDELIYASEMDSSHPDLQPQAPAPQAEAALPESPSLEPVA